MKVGVGSQNPVKIAAVQKAFQKYFPQVVVTGLKVDSKVAKQPIGAPESFQGAKNRAEAVLALLDCDYGVGIEGGIEEFAFGALTSGFVVIINRAKEIGIGTSARMLVPETFLTRIKKHHQELGLVLDYFTNEKNQKQKGGMFGILSQNVVNREEAYYQGVIFALSRFVSTEYYDKE